MTEIKQFTQGKLGNEHIFQCYCGEDSYLNVTHDEEDNQFYFDITLAPSRLPERIKRAWQALRGLEFGCSNEVIIDGSDIKELSDFLAKGSK